MTTIAWDGTTLAADRRATNDGSYLPASIKIRRAPDGRLMGAAGRADVCKLFLDWLSKPDDERGQRPAVQENKDDGCHALEIMPDGSVWRHEQYGAFRLEVSRIAIGSGAPFAQAALMCGKDARGAVEIACALDECTGGPVDELRLP